MTTVMNLFYANATTTDFIQIHGGAAMELAMNEKTGQLWTPTNSPSQNVLAGGPPFSLGGVVNSLKLRGRDAVEEQIPIQIVGATEAAIMDTLSTLRNALNSTSLRSPGVLVFQPNNFADATRYLILAGDVQESSSFINEEAGRLKLRAIITWTRGSTGLDNLTDTLQNAQTITNNANAGSPNYLIMSGVRGDFIYAGQPLIWSITPAANGMFKGSGVQRCYVATLFKAPDYINTNDAISAAGGGSTTPIATENRTISLLDAALGVKLRLIARITSPTSNLEVRIRVVFGNGSVGTGAAIYTSKWIAPGSSTTVVDFGMFRLPYDLLGLSGTADCRIITEARSTNGSTATGTWADMELLYYKTFARITSTVSLTDVALYVQAVASYSALPATANVPYTYPQVQFKAASISGVTMDYPEVIGSLPIGIEDMYLWVVTLTGGVHDSTDTGTMTIISSRLWQTMKGST